MVGLVVEVGLVTALDLSVGLAGRVAAARFTRALLYEVKPFDLWSVAAQLICLLGGLCSVGRVRSDTRNPYRSYRGFAVRMMPSRIAREYAAVFRNRVDRSPLGDS